MIYKPSNNLSYSKQILFLQPFPSARSGHAAVLDSNGSALWVVGGYFEHINVGQTIRLCFDELLRFHIASQTWHFMPTTGAAPPAAASLSAALVDQSLYVFGGTGIPFGEHNYNQMYSCDLDRFEWTLIEPR